MPAAISRRLQSITPDLVQERDLTVIAILGPSSDQPVNSAEVPQIGKVTFIRGLLNRVAGGRWESFESPGEGVDWRMEEGGFAASSLVWEDQVVLHLQVFPKAMAAPAGVAGGFSAQAAGPPGGANS